MAKRKKLVLFSVVLAVLLISVLPYVTNAAFASSGSPSVTGTASLRDNSSKNYYFGHMATNSNGSQIYVLTNLLVASHAYVNLLRFNTTNNISAYSVYNSSITVVANFSESTGTSGYDGIILLSNGTLFGAFMATSNTIGYFFFNPTINNVTYHGTLTPTGGHTGTWIPRYIESFGPLIYVILQQFTGSVKYGFLYELSTNGWQNESSNLPSSRWYANYMAINTDGVVQIIGVTSSSQILYQTYIGGVWRTNYTVANVPADTNGGSVFLYDNGMFSYTYISSGSLVFLTINQWNGTDGSPNVAEITFASSSLYVQYQSMQTKMADNAFVFYTSSWQSGVNMASLNYTFPMITGWAPPATIEEINNTQAPNVPGSQFVVSILYQSQNYVDNGVAYLLVVNSTGLYVQSIADSVLQGFAVINNTIYFFIIVGIIVIAIAFVFKTIF